MRLNEIKQKFLMTNSRQRVAKQFLIKKKSSTPATELVMPSLLLAILTINFLYILRASSHMLLSALLWKVNLSYKCTTG